MLRTSSFLAVTLLLPLTAAADAGFTGVGDLSGGAVTSEALGVSADGRVVVGGSESASGPEAYRWRVDPGIEGLGDLPGGSFESVAADASADGSVIVGGSIPDLTVSGLAFRWTDAGGMVGLGPPFPPTIINGAIAVSGNGDLLVGDYFLGPPCSYVWTVATGLSSSCPIIAEELRNTAVSTNGTVVGWLFNGAGPALFDTLVHRDFQLLLDPTPLSTHLRGEAHGVSADGSVVVGQLVEPFAFDRTTAFRWENDASADLGALGGSQSRATDVSADGAIVVGWADTATGREAFVWDGTSGLRSLQDELENVYGIDLTGWTLDEATAISDDGNVIVGNGTNPAGDPEGFVAVLESDCSNGLDDDADGDVDGDDMGCDDAADLSEKTPLIGCDDGLDNDGDGLVDAALDPGCKSNLAGLENPECQNGQDDDQDGGFDFDGGAAANGGVPLGPADLQCGQPWRNNEKTGGRCGLGPGALLLSALWLGLRPRPRR